MTTTLYASVIYTADGTLTDFTVPFPYSEREHVKVAVDDTGTHQVGTQYFHTFVNDTTVRVQKSDGATITPVENGLTIRLFRQTPLDSNPVAFTDGTTLRAQDIQEFSLASFYVAQEVYDNTTLLATFTDEVSAVVANQDDIDTVAANIADVNTTAADISNVNTVATDIANVNIVATNIADVNTVAAIDADVTAVAADEADIGVVAANVADVNTVAADVSNVNTVAADIANVNTVATDVANVNTVATDIANVNTVATDIANVNTVAGISSDVTTVSGISADVTAVVADQADIGIVAADLAGANTIGTVATDIADVTTVAADIADVRAVAADMPTITANMADINTVATDIADVVTVAADVANVNVVAADIANVNTVATDIANVNTVASNLVDINAFGEQYIIAATAPASPNDGTLWFDTTTDALKVYDGAAWVETVSSVNGTASRAVYTATSGQTVFSSSYDVGFVDVYLNGTKLDSRVDFTATNGTDITLTVGAAAGDIVEVIGYGIFAVADHYTKTEVDALIGNVDATNLKDSSNNIVVSASSGNAAVTGDITVTGTVDGRDIAADGTTLDGIVAGDLDTRYYTETEVDTLLANVAPANAVINRTLITATSGQTSFAATYDVGLVDVWMNGVKLDSRVDYTASSGTAIVLATAATAGDVVEVLAFGAFQVADHYTETEVDALIAGLGSTYYTEAELDAGQLDNRYYTETEVDALLAGVDATALTDSSSNTVISTATGTTDITGDVTVTGTVDGRDLAADGTKLDGIEAGAEVNPTDAEVKTAYEANADTNVFTDAEKTKLGTVDTNADETPSWVPSSDPGYLTSATPSTTYGDVGTYIMASPNASGYYSRGTTRSGSGLEQYNGNASYGSTPNLNTGGDRSGAGVGGTWRAMDNMENGSSGFHYGSLWVRIS